MALDAVNEEQAVSALARYITQPDRYGHESALQTAVRDRMKRMIADMASVIVGQDPKIHEVVDRLIRQTIEQALRDDAFLNRTVTDAVARAIVTRKAEYDADS